MSPYATVAGIIPQIDSLDTFHMWELIRHLQEEHMEGNYDAIGRKCCIRIYILKGLAVYSLLEIGLAVPSCSR